VQSSGNVEQLIFAGSMVEVQGFGVGTVPTIDTASGVLVDIQHRLTIPTMPRLVGQKGGTCRGSMSMVEARLSATRRTPVFLIGAKLGWRFRHLP
jgi:hypothetical protein